MSDSFRPSKPPEQPYKSVSPDTKPQTMHIPTGIVNHLRAVFEQKISEHQYERDEVYAKRAMETMNMLIHNNMKYAEQLRNVEFVTLFHLPVDLIMFVRNHDNLYRATLRCRKRAQEAKSGMTNMDILTGFDYRIGNLRNSFALDVLKEESINLMQRDPNVEQEFHDLANLFERQIMMALTRLDMLTQEITRETELENVGSDHDINDFGQAAPSHRMRFRGKEEISDERDHSILCCICLAQYNGTTHSAFRLDACNHIMGKPCIEAWLNSTATNSTLCPHCRTCICTRRPRRPKISSATTEIVEEYTGLKRHIKRVVALAEEASKVYFEVYNGSDEHDKANHIGIRNGDWMNRLISQLNRRLATNRVNYLFLLMLSDVGRGMIWRLQRTDLAFGVTGA
ncbi:hypothetical protein PTNB73_02958 [Pyrenophora teres f. teres]|nr:hypothetical protein PTNB85_03253 [Pyrenophora teres f. teres]KAE8865864.1 hypothetical protein PTNB29_03011 [Pyrenophora teres f. teres]KAE8871499.1 hypothetical protein PTNB73_02958 [Pyrenophora teres f. teres]